MISKNISSIENKMPVLRSIPLIKPLFSYSQDIERTEEIVFIIEPKIISQEIQENLSLKSLGYQLMQGE